MLDFLLNIWPFMARIGIPLALLLVTGILLELMYARRMLQNPDVLEEEHDPVSAKTEYKKPSK